MTRHACQRFGLLLALALLGSCSMHESAVQWNGHVGPDGEPVFLLRSTYVGVNFGILIPMLGDTDIGSMVNESTAWIGHDEGTHLRLVETETDNFWYGAPPLTWLFTPVMTNMTIEYRPTRAALARENVSGPLNVAQPPR